jgi:hypothetical protein
MSNRRPMWLRTVITSQPVMTVSPASLQTAQEHRPTAGGGRQPAHPAGAAAAGSLHTQLEPLRPASRWVRSWLGSARGCA